MLPLRLFALAVALLCLDTGEARDAALRSTLLGDGATPERVARMVSSPVAFYRGSLALFRRDWRDHTTGLAASRFVAEGARVMGVGDPHVENFGTLLGRDARVTFEPDDLDCAGRVPPLWDLRRLAVGLCVAEASRASSRRPTPLGAALARAAALAYARALGDVVDADPDPGPLIADLLRRGARAAAERAELDELTVRDGATRRLRRGPVDPDDPTERLEDLSPASRRGVPSLLASYRASLTGAPDAEFFTVLDAARALGRGAMSAGQGRALALLRGPTDDPGDDVLVEVKALGESEIPEPAPGDPVRRVLAGRAALWSRPDADPLWGAAWWGACPVQVRAETDAARGLRVSRWSSDAVTHAALRATARALGRRLGAIHRRTLDAASRASVSRDPEAFADEQRTASERYAQRVLDDWRALRRLARGRRLARPAADPTCAVLDP